MSLTRRPAEVGGFSTFRRRKPKPSKRSLAPVTAEVYQAVFRRDGGCVARGADHPWDLPCAGREHWHHRKPVEYDGLSTPDNGLRLCSAHHARVHSHPYTARLYGWLLRRVDVPSQEPVTLTDGRRVFLTADGDYEEAP